MNMKYIIFLLVLSLFIYSCEVGGKNGGDNVESNLKKEIVYNNNIQNVFFGVPLGASREEVIEGFAKHGFYEDSYSTDARLSFNKRSSEYAYPEEIFSFGGMNWRCLYVNMKNNKFYSIEFSAPCKTKEAAFQYFENVLSTVSDKYHMYEEQVKDTTIYKLFVGKTSDKQRSVRVACFSYESYSHQHWYAVGLKYRDEKFIGVSDEL